MLSGEGRRIKKAPAASREAGFHHGVISSTEGGFHPPQADFIAP